MLSLPKMGTFVPEMGSKPEEPNPLTPTALADALFTPVQQRVLGLLFGQPERRFQSAEIIRLAGSGTGAAHRVLERLARSGLLAVSYEGRQKYYQANAASPVFQELVGLMRKTVGLAGPLRAALEPLADRIEMAFVYGSVAGGEDRADSDIDLMILSDDLDYASVYEAVGIAEAQLGRRVNPSLMKPAEWRRKRKQTGSFVSRIHDRPRVIVLGSTDGL